MLPCLQDFQKHRYRLAVVGLGYVGLPLAVAFARHFDVIGFDIKESRIVHLAHGEDMTGETSHAELLSSHIHLTTNPKLLHQARIIIVAVPTPIDAHRNPDLKPLILATQTVARHMAAGSVIVYESTVYPSVTEDICVPILEKESRLQYGQDFTVGYSPERINPGDRVHTLENVVKIVSGSDQATCDLLAEIYGQVVLAGIHKAKSIKVAEAAKVIENTQRDLNIALMNELSVIFDRIGIDTLEVLEAAGTKWNFLPFRPGLVGGHCIGVDPYYLTFKAEELGCHPQVILAGRRINDSMGKHIAEVCVKQLIQQQRLVNGARVGIFGLTFKENVPDLRNTRVIDVVRELEEYGITTLVNDPIADSKEAFEEYSITLHPLDDLQNLDAIIFAVPHTKYADILDLSSLRSRFRDTNKPLMLDVKGFFSLTIATSEGFTYWRL